MRRLNSIYVTIEQLGVWVERRDWLDQENATGIGFSETTLAEIIDNHISERIHLSAIVDGTRRVLEPEALDDFIFDFVWLKRAGLYRVGSRGNVQIRGRSIQVFLPEKLIDLTCPSDELVPAPSEPAGVKGYHRVMKHIRIPKKEAIENWPANPRLDPFATVIAQWRNDILDSLLVNAASPALQKSANTFFTLVRDAALPLSSLSEAEIEQFASTEWPRFWLWLKYRWSGGGEGKASGSRHEIPEAIEYTFERAGQLRYNWCAIEDSLLVSVGEEGLPASHGLLAKRLQKIVSRTNGGPGRTDIDRHFKRYPRFSAGTKGGSKQRPPDPPQSEMRIGVRRGANRRRG
jgi:hypothetical protein